MHYTVRSGSTIIEFTPEYLNALGTGNYTVLAEFDNNYSSAGTFAVVDPIEAVFTYTPPASA